MTASSSDKSSQSNPNAADVKAIALLGNNKTEDIVGHFFIDLTNKTETSIVDIIGAISSGFYVMIAPDNEETRGDIQDILAVTPELRFSKNES